MSGEKSVCGMTDGRLGSLPCGKPVIAVTCGDVPVCAKCAEELDREGCMPIGWREHVDVSS